MTILFLWSNMSFWVLFESLITLFTFTILSVLKCLKLVKTVFSPHISCGCLQATQY